MSAQQTRACDWPPPRAHFGRRGSWLELARADREGAEPTAKGTNRLPGLCPVICVRVWPPHPVDEEMLRLRGCGWRWTEAFLPMWSADLTAGRRLVLSCQVQLRRTVEGEPR